MVLPVAGRRRWPRALVAAAALLSASIGSRPATAGTLTVACPAGAAAVGFADVPPDDVHAADVGCAEFRGLAEGASPSTFAPSATVSREQLATFVARLVRAAGGVLPAGAGAPFEDVPAAGVHAADIDALAAAGVVRGVGPGRFEPAGLVTRNQVASFVVRAYDYATGSTLPSAGTSFSDVADDAHASDIAAAVGAGFVSGYPGGTYRPTLPVSREQSASFLVRALERAVANGHFVAPVPDQAAAPSGPGPCPSDPVPTAVAGPRAAGPGHVEVMSLPDPTAPGGTRPVWVYRPAVPDSSSLPVVYFLHGGLPSGWQALPQHGMAQALDALFASGQAAPFVLAAPDGNTVDVGDPEWANSTDGRDREESFVTGPLIAAVEGAHVRDRGHRAIMGLSMGGYGAANIALHHPGLYGQVAPLQGYYDLDDVSNIFTTGYDEWWNQPDQHADATSGQRWLVGDATGDSEPGIVGEACRMLSVLAAHGVHARAYFTPGVHGWAWLMDNLPAIARFLSGG